MTYCDAAIGVMVCPSIVRAGRVLAEESGVRAKASVPKMIAEAEGARETRVPETVIAGPPGTRVWMPIIYSDALLGSIVSPPIVRGGGRAVGTVANGMVLPPMMTFDAESGRLIGVPETIITPPGVSV